jgi:hypothetical protein
MDKTTQLETIKAYRIRDWHKHFENNRTRDMVKMAWVPVPNKHDGEGFQRIMREKDGMVIYGCWHLILQVASKCLRERGTLLREDGTPLDADAIAYKTGWRSAGDIQRSLDFLCTPQIGWIEQVAQDGQIIPHLPAGIPHLPAGNGIEGNGKEWKSIAPDKPTRKRDPVIDALASLEAEDLAQVTKSSWSKHAKAKQMILSVCQNVTPEEINRRAANYRTHMDCMLTSTALASHWAKCDKPKHDATQQPDFMRGVYWKP